jgi:peptide/nickel transport system permease protein
MTAYIIRRLLLGILVLIMVSLLVFLIMHLLPGDPLILHISQSDIGSYSEQQLAELRHMYGLDKPLMVQYLDWITGVCRGDFGTSFTFKQPVSMLLLERIPVTLNLSILAILCGSIFGISFGVICALRRGRWLDTTLTVLANLGMTLPNFWVGILLIYALSFKFNLLPTYGYTSPFEDIGSNIKQLIMPVFCLAIGVMAGLTRQTRSSMLEVIHQDYIRTAWAKGLSERVIVIRHILKNGLIPAVTTMGMHVSHIVGGAVLIETVFNIPGMGRLMRDAIFGQDYQVVQGGVLVIAVAVVLTNIIVDVSYSWLDPRIRYN